ncbi:UNVERIFIED_CONTAM: hypothetical protein FKN15_073386 [Acipenser sinensis]
MYNGLLCFESTVVFNDNNPLQCCHEAEVLGEKNSGFDVLYHNMKHGQISTKEVSDFIRERATIEEAYARSMTKLAKSASNYSQLGTFAPVWDVFKTSTEKLASCHLELVRKLQELIKEVQKYGEEQIKAHKKTKEEVASTLEAVQNIQSITQTLQKSKENYNAKSVEQERLKKEGATQKELEKAGLKTKKATESYKSYVEKYAVAKTDFEQKMSETAQKFQDIEEGHVLQMKEIIQSYSQSIEETHLQIGQVHNEFVNNMENTTVESLVQKFAETKGTGKERPGPIDFEECNIANVTEGAKPRKRKTFGIPGRRKDKDTDSVDSEDDDEPRKFHVEIKPVQPNNGDHQASASIDELKASIVNITLSPSASLFLPFPKAFLPLSKLKILQYVLRLPQARPFSPPKITNASPPPTAPLARAESTSSISSSTSLTATSNPAVGISRGPSPVSLGSLDSLPIAAAFTESVNAYFKGADPSKCIVKITGDMTVSFPTGIIKIFTSNPSPPVLSFKLKNTSKLEQILPNQQLLYSDPSQSDSNTQDFWMNMQALTAYLRKMSEQNPSASYYNVDILKYQVVSNGIQSTPLNLATYWKCSPTTTDVRVDYRYNPESMLTPGILANVQVLVPVDGGVTNMQSLPTAVW